MPLKTCASETISYGLKLVLGFHNYFFFILFYKSRFNILLKNDSLIYGGESMIGSTSHNYINIKLPSDGYLELFSGDLLSISIIGDLKLSLR